MRQNFFQKNYTEVDFMDQVNVLVNNYLISGCCLLINLTFFLKIWNFIRFELNYVVQSVAILKAVKSRTLISLLFTVFSMHVSTFFFL